MRIGFATDDFSRSYETLGGAGHYRLGLPAAALAENGRETVVGTPCAAQDGPLGVLPLTALWEAEEPRQAQIVWDCDLIVLQRCMWAGFADAMYRARAAGQVLVNDIDDHFDGVPPSNSAFAATHPRRNPGNNVEHYRKTLAASDLVTCSTPFLADHYARYGTETVVVRNAIDLARWDGRLLDPVPRLGWVGVTSHRSGDLEQLRGLLGPLLDGDRYAKQFVHAGHNPEAPDVLGPLGLDEGQVETHDWCSIDDYPALFSHFDVGTVPLRSLPFNDAKSAIKGMEYAASGIPFVASASPEYVHMAAEWGIGRTAQRGTDWLRHLKYLAKIGPEGRAAEGAYLRDRVSAFDIRTRWTDWEQVYSSLL